MTDAVQPRAEEILADAKRWTGGKQRLTAARLHAMLCGEGVDVGYTVVKQIVREWKRRWREVFVPLVYHAGDLAEVDFFEVLVDVAGERRELVPIPSGPDIATISAALVARLDERVGDTFAAEHAAMLPLPTTAFGSARCTVAVAVSSRSLVKVDGAVYRCGRHGRGSTRPSTRANAT